MPFLSKKIDIISFPLMYHTGQLISSQKKTYPLSVFSLYLQNLDETTCPYIGSKILLLTHTTQYDFNN